eukprot:3037-Heterococcus_DN1.PRE.6
MLDKATKNELPEDVPDDLSNLIIDRDTCMASVVGSHDIHIGKLLAREDETRAAETRGMATVVDGYACCVVLCCTCVLRAAWYARAEIDRNRARVMELREFFAVNRRQVTELLYMSSKLLDEFEDGEA